MRLEQQQLKDILLEAYAKKIQVYAHCNGDKAIDSFLTAIEAAREQYPDTDIRPVIIHAQMITQEQLQRAKNCNAIPSFFVSHVFYDGDQFCDKYIGPERGALINPVGWAIP